MSLTQTTMSSGPVNTVTIGRPQSANEGDDTHTHAHNDGGGATACIASGTAAASSDTASAMAEITHTVSRQFVGNTAIDVDHATQMVNNGRMSREQLDATIKRLEKKKSSKQMDVRNQMWKAVLCRFASRKKCLSTARECFYAHGKADMRPVHVGRLKDAGIDPKTGRPVGSTVADVDHIIVSPADGGAIAGGEGGKETRGRSRSMKEYCKTYQVGSDEGLRILLSLPGVNRDYLKSRLSRRNRWSREYRQKRKKKTSFREETHEAFHHTQSTPDVVDRERSNTWYSSRHQDLDFSHLSVSWPHDNVFFSESTAVEGDTDLPHLSDESVTEGDAKFLMSVTSKVLDDYPKESDIAEGLLGDIEQSCYPSLNDVSDLFADSLQKELYQQGPMLPNRGSDV